MINVDDLTIGQARALVAQFSTMNGSAPAQRREHGLNIVVLDRGFVYIGAVTTSAEWCDISDAWNIRRWGTERGLGELVSGPTPLTSLDRVGDVRVPFHALQHMIRVEVEPWSRKIFS